MKRKRKELHNLFVENKTNAQEKATYVSSLCCMINTYLVLTLKAFLKLYLVMCCCCSLHSSHLPSLVKIATIPFDQLKRQVHKIMMGFFSPFPHFRFSLFYFIYCMSVAALCQLNFSPVHISPIPCVCVCVID